MSIGTHQSHCCVKHGCKYGDEDCPVVLKLIKQSYPCEYCHNEGIEIVKEIENPLKVYAINFYNINDMEQECLVFGIGSDADQAVEYARKDPLLYNKREYEVYWWEEVKTEGYNIKIERINKKY